MEYFGVVLLIDTQTYLINYNSKYVGLVILKLLLSGLKLMLKSFTAKKRRQIKLKNLPQVKRFFIFTLWFSTFCNSFKLVQRAFHGGSITFLEINSVPYSTLIYNYSLIMLQTKTSSFV